MFAIPNTKNLTGQISKIEQFPVAIGWVSDIYKARLENGCGLVAVKVLKGRDDTRRRLHREILLWSSLRHPHIAPLLGVSYDFDRPQLPCLVLPYYHHGNVMTYLKEHKDVDRIQIITQVALGLSYLHGLSIIHGDIKGSNILIDDQGFAVLGDFGLSHILKTSKYTAGVTPASLYYTENKLNGTGREEDIVSRAREDIRKTIGHPVNVDPGPYEAPELLEPSGEDINPYTTAGWRWKAVELMVVDFEGSPSLLVSKEADVWSFAMVTLEIFSGSIPFSHIASDARAIVYVTSGGRPRRQGFPEINDNVWSMLERCWEAQPTRRPSMTSLHRFLESR